MDTLQDQKQPLFVSFRQFDADTEEHLASVLSLQVFKSNLVLSFVCLMCLLVFMRQGDGKDVN